MIDYASRQRTPRKHLIGLTVVVVLHGLLFWAINSGLARKFVKVIKGPVEAVLLEETKPDIPPPPPPTPPPPPPPKNLPPPPPSYVPPVDIQVATPPPVNAIAAVSNTPQPVAPPSPLPVQMSAPPAPRTACSAPGANRRRDQCFQLRKARVPQRLQALGRRRHCAAEVLGGRRRQSHGICHREVFGL